MDTTRRAIGFGFLAALPLCTACAFTDMQLTMPTKGLRNAVPGGWGRELVVVKPFTDERRIKDRCGMKKNGYNMDTADAKCLTDPAEWIGRYLADELRASGFRVLTPSDSHRPSAVRIEGALLKLFAEPVLSSGCLETDISVRLVATSETGLRAERTFFVKGVKRAALISSATWYQTSLDRAAQSAAEEMVQAIIELLGQYPQLGAVPTLVPYF